MTTAPIDDTAMTPLAASEPAPSWLPRRWMGLAAAAALLAAVGSVVGLSSAANIYGQETASLADQATAQDLVNLLLVAPLVLVLGWRAHRGHLAAYLGWLGCVAFTVYNYAIYAFSIHFGPLFLVWIGVLGLSIFALLGSLATVDTSAIKACFAGRPLRWPGMVPHCRRGSVHAAVAERDPARPAGPAAITQRQRVERPDQPGARTGPGLLPARGRDHRSPGAAPTPVGLRHGGRPAHLGGVDLPTDHGHSLGC